MKKHHPNSASLTMMSLIICEVLLIVCQPISAADNSVRFATEHFQLMLSDSGQVECFDDLRSGKNYAATGDTKFCVLRLHKNDAGVACDKMEKNGNTLSFSFPGTPVTVKLQVTAEKSYLVIDVIDISGGEFYALQFACVPLTIDYAKDDFSACAMCRKLNTATLDFPGKSKLLGGKCFSTLGYQGAGVFLLGMPEVQLRETMKQVVESYAPGEMLINRAGGPFAMDNPKNFGSYIITSEPITEQQVDEWVAHLSRFGVDQVDFHQGITFRQGDFHFHETAYPNGVSDFRKTSNAFHNHGYMTGLHTYAEFLSEQSKYVTPVPHKDLDVMRTLILAADLDADEQTVSVNESTADVSEITGFFVRNSKVIRIDDELIIFGKPSLSEPYGFTSCIRGAYGTRVASHKKGTHVEHLTQMFSLFAPKKDSELFLEIARETARTYNEGGFDMIYLDALDGTYSIVDDTELTWYYEALFVSEILKHAKKPPLLEYSTFSPSLWYGRSRMGAWDAAHRGYKRFFDKHIEVNQATADRLYLPGQMGWMALCPSHGDNADNFQYHVLFPENVEYLGAKILAYNYGLSYIDIAKNAPPLVFRNGEILKNYDLLRRAGRFSDDTLQRLRDPNAHFLLRHSDNNWSLTEANYACFLLQPDVREFSYHNPYHEQMPMIRIENRHHPAAYESSEGMDLLPLDETQPVKPETIREFEPPLDLSNHMGLGVWVYGDGGDQRINIRLESSPHLVSGFTDHIHTVDFTGWRYFAMAEADNGMADNIKPYPSSQFGNLYEEYRQRVYFDSISKVTLQVEGDTTNLRFRTVRALPLTESSLVDPVVETNGRRITFRGTIRNGHYMEYIPGGRAVVYDAVGHEVGETQPDAPDFQLPNGDAIIKFSDVNGSSVRMTLRTEDNPTEKRGITPSDTVNTDGRRQILRVAQICDTQLGGFVSLDISAAVFQKAVRKINELAPDMVLFAGDMVNNISSDEEIATFKRICAQLKTPVLLTPGNHDLPEPVTAAGLEQYRSIFGEDFQAVECQGYCIISVNSSLWRSASEEDNSQHDGLLNAALRKAKKEGQPVIILSHVPPYAASIDEDDEYFNLPKAKRKDILRLFEENGVILWLCGHTHKTSQRNYGKITILNGESTSANFDDRPRGFRLLTVNPDQSFDWDFISCEPD